MAGMMAEEDNSLQGIIGKIQATVGPRRIRVREFFVDYDPLKCGRCTPAHFARAINAMGVNLSKQQLSVLVGNFSPEGVSRKDQAVHYNQFCQLVDEPPMPSTGKLTMRPVGTLEDEENMHALLQKVAMLCKTRGVVLKYCFNDFDRSPTASPSRINARMAGKVTKSQFFRQFPFKQEIGEENMNSLAERYMNETGDIHYMQLHNEVSDIGDSGMPPYPRSELVLKTDDTRWTHEHLNPVDKLRSRVVEKRVRLYEHFQDFDPLRKGFCTVGQVKTVFAILNLSKELDRPEFDYLVGEYTREDGMFFYKGFCADVDKDFTNVSLEKDPQATVVMPDANTTAPARRNRMALTPQRLQQVYELEEQIRARIRNRRILLNPTFQDMDRTCQGHVTRSQFARVMSMLGFELDDMGLGLLCMVYCDLGNHNDFNYKDFVRNVDPPPGSLSQREENSYTQTLPRYADCTSKNNTGQMGRTPRLAAVF